ncbi:MULTISPECIES: ABC transporter permease [unclassified Chelatococcus]|uniref:ABC transporter permease n=1 Tax=unclassified Chelatococcus TaxID=2638111 RepID=UPI001BCD6A98|nr:MULTISPECIES: ABC transporter permease [unclassified Chelatococcus]CAH1656295.1 ABC-type spermidine/putrescine transport system permease subunit I [Hyphomicrobiales bacterium]MBS7742477.1 ABC transporter permease [Chelatococcus sp. HY11]MBX3542405.1 ABC transporter permease [Chelatococcus sp.]MCO5075378.1 ABC transporter permease [Chelatococcus sp.]CAH1695801.1 ABC-type spermidine/putrescine transport system permease subunit I [Hyphomicrobiales bacterium]
MADVTAASSDRTAAGQLSRSASLALALPLVLLLVLAFLLPVAKLLMGSIFTPTPTAENYLRIAQEPIFLRILLRTVQTAAIVTLLAFVLGYPVALVMTRLSGRAAMLVAACVLIPLWTSVLVRSYAWIVLLQRTGVVNSTLMSWGLIDQPLKLIYTEGAVIVAMTHVLMPYMILPIFSALRSIPPELERAARNLGAGPWTSFTAVTLPLSLPGVYAGAIMVFILSLGFYVTPALVGGPQNLTIATLIGQQTTELLNWPFAGALAGVLLLVTLGLVGLFRRFLSFGKAA